MRPLRKLRKGRTAVIPRSGLNRLLRLIDRLSAQLIDVSMVAAAYGGPPPGDPGVVKQDFTARVGMFPEGVVCAWSGQRLGRVGSANSRPGRPFVGTMPARQGLAWVK